MKGASLAFTLVRCVLAVALASVGSSGCTAEGATTKPAPTTKPSPTLTAKPTPTDDAVSVEQFASIVARYHAEWDERVATVDEDCRDPETVPACSIGYLTLGIMGKTIKLELVGSYDSSSTTYLGDPPVEIAGLLDETVAAARAVGPAGDALAGAPCVDPLDAECGVELLRMEMAVSDLSSQFDAWAPYGG